MNEKLALFYNATFLYESKTYKVIECKIVNGKAVIRTDKQTFVKLESELDVFMQFVEFIENETSLAKIVDVVKEEKRIEKVAAYENKSEVIKETIYKAEIVNANDRALRISEKLEDVFNAISDGETDEKLIKKADAMVRLSNAIVSNEMTRFKYLNLK